MIETIKDALNAKCAERYAEALEEIAVNEFIAHGDVAFSDSLMDTAAKVRCGSISARVGALVVVGLTKH